MTSYMYTLVCCYFSNATTGLLLHVAAVTSAAVFDNHDDDDADLNDVISGMIKLCLAHCVLFRAFSCNIVRFGAIPFDFRYISVQYWNLLMSRISVHPHAISCDSVHSRAFPCVLVKL